METLKMQICIPIILVLAKISGYNKYAKNI